MWSFTSLPLLVVSLLLVAAIAVIGLLRQVQLPATARLSIILGLVLLAIAAAGPRLSRPQRGSVAVLVDLSPSTRTAAYRDPVALRQRVRGLLGDNSFSVFLFSDRIVPADLEHPLTEITSERTIFRPPTDARYAAIVLFSDGRFEMRDDVRLPVYVATDPELDEIRDARIAALDLPDQALRAHVINEGADRTLSFTGIERNHRIASSQVVVQPLQDTHNRITARLNTADPWPENDSLSIWPVADQAQRWWVSESAAPEGWRQILPAELPVEASEYLNATAIVLANVPADAIGQAQQGRLLQYVHDLGGGMMIIGGESAFAAGGYPGSVLEALSPLASTPPTPAVHWILLADSSGSMASPAAGGATRWQLAAGALVKLLASLPANDPVSIGDFARELRWWSQGRSAEATAALSLPPPQVSPHGPTNLQHALESITAGSDGSLPGEILVLTDAQTQLDPAALVDAMRAKRLRAHLLATAELESDHPVRQLVQMTGGTIVEQSNPQQWPDAVRELLRQAAPRRIREDPVVVRFVAPLDALRSLEITRWNQTWAKADVAPLAVATTPDGEYVLAARWNVGSGRVASAAFAADSGIVESLASQVAGRPRDPRFKIIWHAERQLRVVIDAVENGRFMNALRLSVELRDASDPSRAGPRIEVPQTAPGRYELAVPAPRQPMIALLRWDDRILQRHPIARRYAPEFESIGNDRDALRALAEQTGGRVISQTDAGPIDFRWPQRNVLLTAPLAMLGAVLIAIGLTVWKVRTV